MGIEACNAVLAGDLFNKTTNKVSEKESYVATRAFFSMSESEAFNNYKKFTKNNTGGNGNINVNFFVKLMPVGLNAGGGGFREFTEEEFRQEFQKWKTVISQQINDQGEFSFESEYNSFVRDEKSIQAWRDCVIAAFKDDDGGLLVFGSRDDSGRPFLEIEWRISAELAQNRSFLKIKTPDGITIQEFTQRTEIANITNNIVLLDISEMTDEMKSKGFTIGVTVDVIDKDDFDKDDFDLIKAVPIAAFAARAVFPRTTIPSSFIDTVPTGFRTLRIQRNGKHLQGREVNGELTNDVTLFDHGANQPSNTVWNIQPIGHPSQSLFTLRILKDNRHLQGHKVNGGLTNEIVLFDHGDNPPSHAIWRIQPFGDPSQSLFTLRILEHNQHLQGHEVNGVLTDDILFFDHGDNPPSHALWKIE